MSPYLITITEYCSRHNIDLDFINQLEDESLIVIQFIDNDRWIDDSQFRKLEQYIRWYYDLEINIQGIDVIQNLLDRMDEMQAEMNILRERLRLLD